MSRRGGDPIVLECATRWKALHDAFQPPEKPLPNADLLNEAKLWDRRRRRLQRERAERDRLLQEATKPKLPEAPPPRPRPLLRKMTTTSHHIRERTRAAMGAGGAGVSFAEDDYGEEEDDEEENTDTADDDDDDDGANGGGSGSAPVPLAPGLSRQISPGGVRRVRCTLGTDRRWLMVPRTARFEEVKQLARAKFELRADRPMRLLCADPQLIASGTPAADALITLTCDADYEHMWHEHGEKLALRLALDDGALDGASAPQTPAAAAASNSTGDDVVGSLADVLSQALGRALSSTPGPASRPMPPSPQPRMTPPMPPPLAPPPAAPPPPPLPTTMKAPIPPPLPPPAAAPPPPPPQPPPPRPPKENLDDDSSAAGRLSEAPEARAPRERTGPLYVNAIRPEQTKKTRQPKNVQKGLEAAFRKRQNIKLRQDKEQVMEALKRVLDEGGTLTDEASLRELFRETSEMLSGFGLALGGSEDWADRLYIEDKKGGLLFSEEELDAAEEAQKRMELMYNVDAWSTQLVVRVGSGQLLLTAGIEGTREDVLNRVLKRMEEDVRYHSELFDEPTSALILTRIETMGLPNTIRALGNTLLDHCAELLRLAVSTLNGMVAGVVEQKMKAVRAVAAQKVVMCIERVRATLGPLRSTFVRARHELGDLLDQLLALLEECSAKVTPHLPQAQDDSSDDDYF